VSGLDRIHFITDYLYNYDYNPPEYCYRRHEIMDEFKCKLKTPILPLEEGLKKAKFV
jgi:hypothetical protein